MGETGWLKIKGRLAEREFDRRHVETLLENADRLGITLDTNTLEYAFRKNIERIAEQVYSQAA